MMIIRYLDPPRTVTDEPALKRLKEQAGRKILIDAAGAYKPRAHHSGYP